MRLIACMLLLVASAANGQTVQHYDTCGTNTVTELDAGAIRLASDDVVFEVDRSSAPTQWANYVFQPVAGFDIVVAICNEPPGPLTRCQYLDASGAGTGEFVQLQDERYFVVIEAAPEAAQSCGGVTVHMTPPLG
jgi:hypothetical protein